MATPALDLSLFVKFAPAFIFIVSLVLIYALLSHTKPVGDQKFVYAIVALGISIMIILSPPITRMIVFLAPWFTVLFIFIIFSLVAYKIFGATDADIHGVIKTHGGIQWTIAIIAILIALGALSSAFGQDSLTQSVPETEGIQDTGDTITFDTQGNAVTSQGGTGTSSFQTNLARTFYHPKTLGILFILILSALTIALLSGKASVSGGGGHDHGDHGH